MITAATWVPRGFAAQYPSKFELTEEEFERIGKLSQLQLDDAREDLEEAQGGGDDEEEEMEEEMDDAEDHTQETEEPATEGGVKLAPKEM